MNYEDLIIEKITNKYKSDLDEIKEKYYQVSLEFNKQSLYNCMLEQRKIVKNIINDILSCYSEIKKCDFVMLNGSFARHTNINQSDIDLNIMYDDKYKNILFPIELKINYIVSRVLDFRGCDRIHSIMVYTPLVTDEKIIFDGSYLIYNNEKIKYYFRENYEKLLHETLNTSRNYKKLVSYFNDSNGICNEWQKNFELICDFGTYNNFINEIIINNKKNRENENFQMLIKKEIDNLISIIQKIDVDVSYGKMYIKDMKKQLKTNPINILNKTLSILSTIYNVDILKLEICVRDKELEQAIYYYLWTILRINFVLNSFNLDLSSHSSKMLDTVDFNNKYYYTYKKDFREITLSAINLLYEKIINILKDERRKIK